VQEISFYTFYKRKGNIVHHPLKKFNKNCFVKILYPPFRKNHSLHLNFKHCFKNIIGCKPAFMHVSAHTHINVVKHQSVFTGLNMPHYVYKL